MPRPRQVTRTVQVTEATVLCLYVPDNNTEPKHFTIAGSFRSQSILLKRIKDLYETDFFKPLHILQSHPTSYHYTMPEQKYIDNATKII